MPLCPHNRPSGEPVPAPVYPIPPPGEYYATARWVKDFVNRAILSVDSTGVKELIDNLLATWDPSFAMKKVSGVTGQLAQFDSQGQVVGSGANIEDFVTRESLDTVAEAVSGKVDKVPGKGLSTNDFTNEFKEKLDALSETPGEKPIEIDDTLTKSGTAADSAAVGSAIRSALNEISSVVSDAKNSVDHAVRSAKGAEEAAKVARAKTDNKIYDAEGNETGFTYVSSEVVDDLKTQLGKKVNASDIKGLRREADLAVYDENGEPEPGNGLATHKWVKTFLSENYDIAEITTYGTGE
jgi:hypothetical protein